MNLVAEYGIDPANIELEITETHIMKNHDIAIKKLTILKEYGFSLAIDDFGTGYSSLSYLKYFPIDKLKIDKSFVLNIHNDPKDEAIVKSIIQLGKLFGLSVQAEGVENDDAVKLLGDLGCEYLQGYYFAKPIPYEAFITYITTFGGSNGS